MSYDLELHGKGPVSTADLERIRATIASTLSTPDGWLVEHRLMGEEDQDDLDDDKKEQVMKEYGYIPFRIVALNLKSRDEPILEEVYPLLLEIAKREALAIEANGELVDLNDPGPLPPGY